MTIQRSREGNMTKHWTWMSMIFALTLLSGGCSSSKSGVADGPPQVATAAAAVPPAKAAQDADVVATGPIVVEQQVEVAAQRDGLIAEVVADVGAGVRKGTLLARLDDRQLRAERDAAEAKLLSIQADVKNWEAETKVQEADQSRAEQMRKAELNTQQDVEHARYKVIASRFEVEREMHDLENGKATLRSLDLELEKTRIVAPFDGVVARRYVRAGESVRKGERLFWVTATSPMRVRFTLPEQYLGRVKPGQTLSVASAATPEEKHAARVILVSPVVDPASGTIEVLAQLVGPAGALRPGMTANIRLTQPQ